jgi:hypothetical protein
MPQAMPLSRRSLLTGGAASGLLALTGAAPALAAPMEKMSDAELLAALRNVFWISAQAPHPKTFYVIAAPWCGVCKFFYGQLRNKTGFQARFVLAAPHTEEERKLIAYAILCQSEKGLDAIYSSRRAPEPLGSEAARQFAVDVNIAAEMALTPPLKERLRGAAYGYPVVLFRTHGGLVAIAGAPNDPDKLLALVEARDGAQNEVSGLTPFLSSPPAIDKASRSYGGARRNGVSVYAAPHLSSPKLQTLSAFQSLTMVGETTVEGRTWLALQVFRQGRPYGYALAEDFAT